MLKEIQSFQNRCLCATSFPMWHLLVQSFVKMFQFSVIAFIFYGGPKPSKKNLFS